MKGVAAVHVFDGSAPGTEVLWAGWEIAAVAAETEELARDAARAVKVEYEVLPHFVNEADLSKAKAAGRVKPAGEKVTGDPDQAFKEADVVSEGVYGCPVICHLTWEAHGQVIEWKGDQIEYWPTTQAVSSIGNDLAKALGVPPANVHVMQDHMGVGYGSKFSPDRWGIACAKLSKQTGRPVKLFLPRDVEQMIAGNRPSHYARIRLAAKKDGTIIGWESESWSTGGMTGGGAPPIPYVYTNIPNQRLNHTAVQVNAAPQRAWRAPNHPQASYLTCCAMDDLAHKLGMDPLELFKKNADYTARPDVYRWQLDKAAELIGWKKLWHPRGDKTPGRIKRGLGIGVRDLGWRWPSLQLPVQHLPGRHGRGRTGQPGSRHRYPHRDRNGGGGNPRLARGRHPRQDRGQPVSVLGNLRRLDHRGRGVLVHPQGHDECAGKALRA
jgi:xanthine dehydrogenase YagR molybdenum-binding subunit